MSNKYCTCDGYVEPRCWVCTRPCQTCDGKGEFPRQGDTPVHCPVCHGLGYDPGLKSIAEAELRAYRRGLQSGIEVGPQGDDIRQARHRAYAEGYRDGKAAAAPSYNDSLLHVAREMRASSRWMEQEVANYLEACANGGKEKTRLWSMRSEIAEGQPTGRVERDAEPWCPHGCPADGKPQHKVSCPWGGGYIKIPVRGPDE